MLLDEQKELMRNLLFLSTNMAAITWKPPVQLSDNAKKRKSTDRYHPYSIKLNGQIYCASDQTGKGFTFIVDLAH